MAGVTDQAFRDLCRRWGAALATTEMIGSRPELRDSRKTRMRLVRGSGDGPLSVQIAGFDPRMMADAARFCVDNGADIVDINMGCPAKKVCNKAAGSALLQDEPLVGRILEAVVAAVEVPVTLKTRIGWSETNRNGERIARIAEAAGVRALAIHGRTREGRFHARVDYDAIAAIRAATRLPLIANGDIHSPADAAAVLARTGADAVMIGRAAQGRPWLFAAVNHYLASGEPAPAPDADAVAASVLEHLDGLHALYGAQQGPRIARKHLRWYFDALDAPAALWPQVAAITQAAEQRALVSHWLRDRALARAA